MLQNNQQQLLRIKIKFWVKLTHKFQQLTIN